MRAMPSRLWSERQYDGPALRDSRDLALDDAELGWTDEIAGGIDRKERRTDFLLAPGEFQLT